MVFLSRKKILHNHSRIVFPIVLVAVVIAGALFWYVDAPTVERRASTPPAPTAPISLIFVGDIMMDRGVKQSVLNNFGGDYNALFANAPYLKNADIAFANLEGTVATSGHNVGSRFSFHMDPVSVGALKNAGFDIVSFANNHVGDWSMEAFTESLQHLRDNDILYAGAGSDYADASAPRIIDVRGIKIGFLGATDVGPDWLAAKSDTPGIILASNPHLPNIIATAKQKVDILVMSFHWGVEYSPANARQEALARGAIDAGADIIVGTHPHVMQRVEWYKGKPIFYSLGNFVFDQYFSPYTLEGMVADVSVDPQTKEISATEEVAPISKQFVPQPLIPFDESMLVTKKFTP
ncbi:MAG TPA: CapA family protein [Candidatus Paceibacterota bacterium]|nr:CapA family protein [Candidatus Paceibacterota bacterium]